MSDDRPNILLIMTDPRELIDLSKDPRFVGETAEWRDILAKELEGRPEGFSDGRRLRALGHPTPRYLPGYERKDDGWH